MPDPAAHLKANGFIPIDGGVWVDMPDAVVPFCDKLPAHIERLKRRHDGKELPVQMPSTWQPISAVYRGGWWPEQYMLVGNTGTGKTQFALQAALAAAKAGHPTLYISLEIDELELAARLLAGEARGVEWAKVLKPMASGDQQAYQDAQAQAAVFDGLPFYTCAGTPMGFTPNTMREEVAKVRARHPKDDPDAKTMFVVLDYLQLVSGQGELRERIRDASYAGVDVARTHDAAVLMISSTARSNYKLLDGSDADFKLGGAPASARKLIGVGKESGEIEFAAANLIVLCADGHIALAKVRAGEPGWLKAEFNGALGTFTFTAEASGADAGNANDATDPYAPKDR